MKVIGVTGGVGAGKSEVLGYIAGNWNATVVEADEVGYLVMRPGKACYSAIVDLFGVGILKEDETLDREQIAKIVFEDKEMLAKMNAIVHPAVKEYIRKAIKREEENETDIFIVEAALLIEDKYDEICDELWYIYTSEENRRERLKLNRGYSDEKIDNIFASQLPESTYREVCKAEIDNNHLPEDAFSQIDALMKARQVEKVQKRQTTEE